MRGKRHCRRIRSCKSVEGSAAPTPNPKPEAHAPHGGRWNVPLCPPRSSAAPCRRAPEWARRRCLVTSRTPGSDGGRQSPGLWSLETLPLRHRRRCARCPSRRGRGRRERHRRTLRATLARTTTPREPARKRSSVSGVDRRRLSPRPWWPFLCVLRGPGMGSRRRRRRIEGNNSETDREGEKHGEGYIFAILVKAAVRFQRVGFDPRAREAGGVQQ